MSNGTTEESYNATIRDLRARVAELEAVVATYKGLGMTKLRDQRDEARAEVGQQMDALAETEKERRELLIEVERGKRNFDQATKRLCTKVEIAVAEVDSLLLENHALLEQLRDRSERLEDAESDKAVAVELYIDTARERDEARAEVERLRRRG